MEITMGELINTVLERKLQVTLAMLRFVIVCALLVCGLTDIDRATYAINVFHIFPEYLDTNSKTVLYIGIAWICLAVIEILIMLKVIVPKVLFKHNGEKFTFILIYRYALAAFMPMYIFFKLMVLHAPFYPLDIVAVFCFPPLLIAVSICENYDN